MKKIIFALTMSLLLTIPSYAAEPEIHVEYLSEPYPGGEAHSPHPYRGDWTFSPVVKERIVKKEERSREEWDRLRRENRYMAVFRAIIPITTATGRPPRWEEIFKTAPDSFFSSDEERQAFEELLPIFWTNRAADRLIVGPAQEEEDQTDPREISHRSIGHVQVVHKGVPQGHSYIKVPDKPVTVQIYEFRFFGPTAEKAEELAKTAIRLYNAVIVEEERRRIIEILESEKKIQPELQLQVEKAQEKVEELTARLAQYPEEEIQPETISALETQKWLVSVDIAGIEARINAIRKVEGGPTTIREDSQIAAQIDLADLLARKAKIESILTFYENRNKARADLEQAESELKRVVGLQTASQRMLDDLTYNLDSWFYQPFAPIDNVIIVQPLDLETITRSTPPPTGPPPVPPGGASAPAPR